MTSLNEKTLQALWYDRDTREVTLRRVVTERLAQKPTPKWDDYLVASYFFAQRTLTLEKAVKEIAYHATSGTKDIEPGSLIEQCTGKVAGIDAFDSTGRIGLLHMAFPLKMLLQPDGHLTSTDIMHTAANAIIFDVFENQDARLISLQIPDKVIKMMEEKVPMGRLGKPEEIANTYAWLASDEASYINGAVIEVSGGCTI